MSKGSKSNPQTGILEKLRQIKLLIDACLEEIRPTAPSKQARAKRLPVSARNRTAKLDFDTNERAFIKEHGQNLSGPKKFVLLLAYLTKGEVGKDIRLKDVEAHWNRMTAPNLLDGTFNRFYSSSAKESGWVNTKKQGVYFLRPSWQDVLK